MYYINVLYFFSFLGFCLESNVYKINNSNRHSGIFYGPITMVYGFGILAIVLLKKYFLDKLQCHKFLKLFITFLTCWITLTIIEWLGGNILYQLFHINMWNYTKKPFNCGKYICLELSLIWGFLGTIYLYCAKDFFDKIISLIPQKLTIAILIINLIDTLLVFINKLP
ncbi:MAG: putative ABC transporter permease [Erysipelotrichaceae bacterium]|nr:putative ABC transporter permease [Erysipelotrichaceae bacterium]